MVKPCVACRFAAGLCLALVAYVTAGSPKPRRFLLDRGSLVLTAPACSWNHVEALGPKAGIWGTVGGSFEAWAYPFKLFHGLELHISADGGKTFQSAAALVRSQVATPHMAQLRLVTDRCALWEVFFVPREGEPAVVVLLDVDTGVDLDVAVRLRPSLAPMGMQVPKHLRVSWDEDRRELVACEPGRRLELRVGSPFAVTYSRLAADAYELRLKITREAARQFLVPVVFGIAWPDGPVAARTIDEVIRELPARFAASLAYYRRLLAGAPRVETPDPVVNDALAWSVVSLDQLRVCNPVLGHGIVSGYSASGAGTRPRYCWFFDEPTLGSWAYLRAGLDGHVREAFRFLQRYQREDGKTVHEIDQSFHLRPDYLKTFRYAYIHTDGPVYFLAAYGHYFRSTGDIDFIRAEWPRILKTLTWCLSVVDPQDGLMRIEPKDWGSAESSFTVWKDTQLEAMWVQALRSAKELAGAMGDAELSERCARAARKASESIEEKLWNEEASFYLWGIDRRGQPLRSLVPHHALGIWLGSFRKDRALRCLETMASADFRTDWGVRSLSLAAPAADPAAYQTGSVWPVWNGGLLISDFRYGRGVEGFRNWRAMIRARSLDGLGPMPEVLHGRFYKRLGEGVPHQLFSEVAVQNGFYEGLLGLDIDVPQSRITVAPYLPPQWNRLRVTTIPVGRGDHLDLSFTRSRQTSGGTSWMFEITPRAHTKRTATLCLAPHLPAGAVISAVEVDGKAHAYEVETLPTGVVVARLALVGPMRPRRIRIRYEREIDFMPMDEPIEPGGVSRNLRIIRASLEDGRWRMVVEGRPDRDYFIDFFTARRPVPAAGDCYTVVARRSHGVRMRLRAPADCTPSRSGFVRWEVEILWR